MEFRETRILLPNFNINYKPISMVTTLLEMRRKDVPKYLLHFKLIKDVLLIWIERIPLTCHVTCNVNGAFPVLHLTSCSHVVASHVAWLALRPAQETLLNLGNIGNIGRRKYGKTSLFPETDR